MTPPTLGHRHAIGINRRERLPDGRIVFVHTAPNALLGRWYIMNGDGTHVESLPQLNRVKAGNPIDWFWGRSG